MSARIFIHPACFGGSGAVVLAEQLTSQGFDLASVRVGPESKYGHRELVRFIGNSGAVTMFERMDGSRFLHRAGEVAPPPEPRVA